jgi:hypothetical protein
MLMLVLVTCTLVSAADRQPPPEATVRLGRIVGVRTEVRGESARQSGRAERPLPPVSETGEALEALPPSYGDVALVIVESSEEKYLVRVNVVDQKLRLEDWPPGLRVELRFDSKTMWLRPAETECRPSEISGVYARLKGKPLRP